MPATVHFRLNAQSNGAKQSICVTFLLLLATLSLSSQLFAQDTFIAGTGNWSLPANWSFGQPPLRTQDCLIPANSVVISDLAGECLDITMQSGSTVTAAPGYVFIYGPSIVNQGTLNIGASNGLGILAPTGVTTSLTGAGTINLGAGSRISGSGAIFANVDNSIHGQGQIGMGTIGLVNNSLIDANTPSGILVFQANGAGATNTGTIQASNGGTLQLVAGFDTIPFSNTGLIQALNGSTVTLAGYTYTGGTFSTTGTGTFQIVPANNTIWNNLTNAASYHILAAAYTTLEGTINNNGTFFDAGELIIHGGVALKGSGSILGQGALGGRSVIGSDVGGGALTNQELIHGGGGIGDSTFSLINQATVNADDPTNQLTLVGAATTNTNTMEASGGATLQISNTVNNLGGTIEALNASTVVLAGTVSGGTLSTAGTGSIQSQNGTLDGTVNIPTNAGAMTVSGQNSLNLKGTINNSGTIVLSNTACIVAVAPTIVTGSGTITMGPTNCIFGAGQSFTNQSKIQGAGTIGDSNPMPIVNKGTIVANQGSTLFIVPDASGFTNLGTLVVNSGSTMQINNLFKNLAKNKLTGGVYGAAGALNINNANIVTNSASITLSGPSAQIFDTLTNSSALRNLASNTGKGIISLAWGQNLTTSANFTNAAILTVDATSSFTVGGTFIQTGGTTTVDGKLNAPAGFILKKGKVFGKGTIAATLSSTGNGVVTVGDSATTTGVFSVSSFSQGATGVLDLQIAGTTVGTQYSQLSSLNGVSLGGILNIKRIKFVPSIGSTFTIVTGSAITSQFATVNGLPINSAEHFAITYSSTAVTLTVVAGP